MNKTSKQVGYLKGLLDSMTLDENKTGDKLLKGIVEVLCELSDRADVVDELLDDLNDYVESIDDDLSALEGDAAADDPAFPFFGGEDGDEDEDFDDEFDSAEDQLHILRPETPAEPQSMPQPEPLAGALCSECLRLFFVSLDDPADAMYICPHCGRKIHPIALSPENAPVVEPVQD